MTHILELSLRHAFLKFRRFWTQELRDIAQNAVDGMSARKRRDDGEVSRAVRSAVSSYLSKHTKRSPMVIPMVTML